MKNHLLDRIGHIAEIHRTLRLFSLSKKRNLREREIVVLANQTTGEVGRYPRPRSALRIAENLGLVRKHRQGYSLTSLGRDYTGQEFSLNQNKFLFGLLVDDEEIGLHISDFLVHAQSNRKMQVPQISLTTTELRNTAKLLQQLGAFEYKAGWFVLTDKFEESISSLLLRSRAAIKEEDLWKRLDSIRLRAKFIEEKVVAAEQLRLRAEGQKELAHAVTRISELDVGAGYDIASFEVNGEPRYIEVKSSIGRKLNFEWSKNERVTAEKLGNRYWIYFVPFAHMVEKDIACLIRIKHPIKKIGQKSLVAKPSMWSMNLSKKATTKLQSKIDKREAFDW